MRQKRKQFISIKRNNEHWLYLSKCGVYLKVLVRRLAAQHIVQVLDAGRRGRPRNRIELVEIDQLHQQPQRNVVRQLLRARQLQRVVEQLALRDLGQIVKVLAQLDPRIVVVVDAIVANALDVQVHPVVGIDGVANGEVARVGQPVRGHFVLRAMGLALKVDGYEPETGIGGGVGAGQKEAVLREHNVTVVWAARYCDDGVASLQGPRVHDGLDVQLVGQHLVQISLFGHDLPQIVLDGVGIGVLFQVRLEASAERAIAENAIQHVGHAGSLAVRDGIEHASNGRRGVDRERDGMRAGVRVDRHGGLHFQCREEVHHLPGGFKLFVTNVWKLVYIAELKYMYPRTLSMVKKLRYVAKPSFSHRSFHQRIVTRLPNH